MSAARRLATAAGGSGRGGGGDDGRIRMTPQLQQALRLLELSRRELIAEIRAELGVHEATRSRGEE